MTEEILRALFLLANIEIKKVYRIKNEYYPPADDQSPWWLVPTKWGLIKIGWRKRVINIDWEDTGLVIDKNANKDYEFHKVPITRDDVTQWEHGIHAWGYAKAVEYLVELKLRFQQYEYCTSVEGIEDLALRKKKFLEENEDEKH